MKKNKDEIVSAVSRQTGTALFVTEEIIDAFVDEIMNEVSIGNSVYINKFGTFRAVQRAERTGRNLDTMEPIKIPACTKPEFRPSSNFKRIMHKGVK